MPAGQTEVADAPTTTDDDFLARERAALGEDADQFATAQDHVGGNVDNDDDLLGGGEPVEEIGQFESSFPSVDTQNQNEVRSSHLDGKDNADEGVHLFSGLRPAAQSLAPAHLSLLPATQTPKSQKMRVMLSGEFNSASQTMRRMAASTCTSPHLDHQANIYRYK